MTPAKAPVLLVSVDAFPKMGGISTMTHQAANAIAATGRRVILLAPAGSHVPTGFARAYELCEDWESDIAARDGPRGLIEDRRIQALVGGLIARERPDQVILMHAFYYGPGVLRAANAAGIPLSVVVHGTELTSQLAPADAHGPARTDPDHLGARLLTVLRGADRVLANSACTARHIGHLAGIGQVGIIGVGLSADRLRDEARNTPLRSARQQAARRRALDLPDGPVLAYIGRLARHKHIDRLLRLTAALPEASCIIGGDGPERDGLLRLGRELGLGHRLHLLGPLSESEKWRYLRAADFSALLSAHDPETGAYEGFGISLLEASAGGAVPVSTGADGMAEFMAGDAPPGLILPEGPGDPAADAARIYTLWRDPERMVRLIARGRDLIADRHTWDHVAARILTPSVQSAEVERGPLRHAG